MTDTLSATAAELARTRVPFVRATVVRAQHPTSSHAGDTALVRADGTIEGFVGGTCSEASVREYGLRVLRSNEPLLLRIVPGNVPDASEHGAVTVANPCLSGGAMEIFLEPQLPAPRVLVVGETPVARALAQLGGPLGFAVEVAVEVADRRAGRQAEPRGDDAALIVASHGRGEEAALTAALRKGVPYVALVASRTRGAAVVAALDVPESLQARVHTPAGLQLGARTAPEVALSILAQLVAERRAASRAEPQQVATPATAVDPVCGMTVAAVPASVHLDAPDGTVWFCCAGCREAFTADPDRYAAAG